MIRLALGFPGNKQGYKILTQVWFLFSVWYPIPHPLTLIEKTCLLGFNGASLYNPTYFQLQQDTRQTKRENSSVFAPNYEFEFPQKWINWRQSWWLMKRETGTSGPRNAPSHHVATNAAGLEVVMLPVSIWWEVQLLVNINLELC